MGVPSPNPYPSPRPTSATIASVRDELRKQQDDVKKRIDVARAKQRQDDAEQARLQADLTALDAVITAQQTGATATQAAIDAADATIRTLEPKIKATLDDHVEADLDKKHGDLKQQADGLDSKVTTAERDLKEAQDKLATAQHDLDGKKAEAQQYLAALKALPADIKSLTTTLTRQRTDLQTAYDAGNFPKAYVLLLELQVTQAALKDIYGSKHEQDLADAYQKAVDALPGLVTTLAEKQDAVDAAQKALAEARAAQQQFQKDRPGLLQAIWSPKP